VIFSGILAQKVYLPRLFKFIYDNIWQSAAQNRSEKEKEVIQTCSDGNACFELTHFLQSNNRFLSTAIDFTFHKPIWAKSLDTQPGKRLSHTSNVEMCYAKKNKLHATLSPQQFGKKIR